MGFSEARSGGVESWGGPSSSSRSYKSSELDLEGIISSEKIAEIQLLRRKRRLQTKVIRKKDKVKSDYLNNFANLLGLKFWEL